MHKIEFRGNTAEELRLAVVAFAGMLVPNLEQDLIEKLTETEADETAEMNELTQQMKTAPTPAPVAAPTGPAQQQTETPAPAKTGPATSMEDIRAKLAALMQAGKREEVKALFGQVQPGAQKLSDVPADKYDALMIAAEAVE